MISRIVSSGLIAIAAYVLSGCGQSTGPSKEVTQDAAAEKPVAPQSLPAAPAPPAQTITAATAVPPASQTLPNPAPTPAPEPLVTKETAIAPVSQFASAAAAQPDKVAASIGSDLAAKAKSLTQSAMDNESLKSGVSSALQSLSAGKDATALTTLFQQAKAANLTPQQTTLVKDVGNLASAYVVQRNFASVDGAQGDVATIVNSLRKGEVTPAVPALQSLAQNATLTPQQKDLLGTVAERYAPGLKKASDSLKQGLQSLQGLGK